MNKKSWTRIYRNQTCMKTGQRKTFPTKQESMFNVWLECSDDMRYCRKCQWFYCAFWNVNVECTNVDDVFVCICVWASISTNVVWLSLTHIDLFVISTQNLNSFNGSTDSDKSLATICKEIVSAFACWMVTSWHIFHFRIAVNAKAMSLDICCMFQFYQPLQFRNKLMSYITVSGFLEFLYWNLIS